MLAGDPLASRLWTGTGGLTSLESVRRVVEAAEPGLVTVSMRRTSDLAAGGLLATLRELGVRILPNTAGCLSAREAVLTAELAREALQTDWVKLEVIGDERSLLPDVVGLVDAAATPRSATTPRSSTNFSPKRTPSQPETHHREWKPSRRPGQGVNQTWGSPPAYAGSEPSGFLVVAVRADDQPAWDPAVGAIAHSRSTVLRTLPETLVGNSSTKWICFGSLNPARYGRVLAMMSSAEGRAAESATT